MRAGPTPAPEGPALPAPGGVDLAVGGARDSADRDRYERQLAARVRIGDTEAFHTLFLAYAAPLTRFAAGYVQAPDVAEEIAQDVFLWIWEHRERWQAPTSIRAYLYLATRNASLSYRRHQRVVSRLEEHGPSGSEIPGMGASAALPGLRLEREELHDRLWRAVAELPEAQRLVVTLRWHHQLSHAEVAQVAGISVKTVSNHITRALNKLRAVLAGDRDP